MRACTHGGWACWQRFSTTFWLGKTLTLLSCAHDGVRTSSLWISRPRFYQLSNPVTSSSNSRVVICTISSSHYLQVYYPTESAEICCNSGIEWMRYTSSYKCISSAPSCSIISITIIAFIVPSETHWPRSLSVIASCDPANAQFMGTHFFRVDFVCVQIRGNNCFLCTEGQQAMKSCVPYLSKLPIS